MEGGADLLLLETVFDTLNAKAALFAQSSEYFEASGNRVPVMVSVTIVDQSGRTLSGQTVEAFWISVSHMNLLSVGINCALGAKADAAVRRGTFADLRRCRSVAIPMRDLPNAFGGFDETPERMAADLARFCGERLAEHWWAAAAGRRPRTSARLPRRCAVCAPHVLSKPERYTRFSGLEAAGTCGRIPIS